MSNVSYPQIRAAVAVALLALSGRGALAADAASGERIATRWCAACHLVSPSQSHASDAVPSFARLAHRDHFDAKQLAALLANPHPPMPSLSLSQSEIADLAEYMRTLAQ